MRGRSELIILVIGAAFLYPYLKEYSFIFEYVFYSVAIFVPVITFYSLIKITHDRFKFVYVFVDKDVWIGEMLCRNCNYTWVSNRQVPPAKCAGCGGRNIIARTMKKKEVMKFPRAEIKQDEWSEIKKNKATVMYPAWLFVLILITVAEFIYLAVR